MNFLSRGAVAAMALAWIASVAFAAPVAKTAKPPAPKRAKVRPDTAAANALRRAVDSLVRQDSLRRTDSVRVADSTRRVADSLHLADSLARAARTWYVVRPNRDAKDSAAAALFHRRLCIALRRTGKVFVAGDADSAGSSWEASWDAARAAGAGKVLLPSLRIAGGRATIDAWISSSSEAGRFDSVRVQADAKAHPARWAQVLADRLLPSAADSACRADSTLQAGLRWSAAASSGSPDTAALRMLVRRLGDGIRQSGRATWVDPPPPGDSLPADSVLRAAGVSRLVRLKLVRGLDSAWVLDLRSTNLSGDTLFDSLRVVDPGLSRLVARAVPELFPAPPSCGSRCARATTRSVWAVSLATDPALGAFAAPLARQIHAAFRARTDRQFLSLPDSLSGARLDSTARARGVSRLVRARLSGSDSAWVLSVAVRHPGAGALDSGVLRRGGPPGRVHPWLARHLAGWGATGPECDDSCRLDSLREAARRWAVVAVPSADSAPDSTAALLAGAFPRRSRVEILQTLPGCAQPACLDSLAAARGIDKLAWAVRGIADDSTRTLRVRVADVVSDVWTDSVIAVGRDADPAVLARSAPGIWAALLPSRRCDSCVSRDTLEDALVVEPPRWEGAGDERRWIFRDSALRALAGIRTYQVVDPRGLAGNPRAVLDSAQRADLACRTGAVHRLRTEVRLEKAGWRVAAFLEEVATGKVVASVDYQDRSMRPDRPPELAAWAVRRLLGLETRAKAPDAVREREFRKALKLGIPAAVGILLVVLNW